MRFTDLFSVFSPAPPAGVGQDFVLRKRVPGLVQFFTLWGAGLIVVCAARDFAESFGSFFLFASIALALVAGVSCYGLQRARDAATEAEFQNALFASSMCLNAVLCLIVDKNGTVVYADRGFNALFPEFSIAPRRTLDEAIAQMRLSPEEGAWLTRMLAAIHPEQISVMLHDAADNTQRVMLVADPLPRPQGYLLVRARPYVENRS